MRPASKRKSHPSPAQSPAQPPPPPPPPPPVDDLEVDIDEIDIYEQYAAHHSINTLRAHYAALDKEEEEPDEDDASASAAASRGDDADADDEDDVGKGDGDFEGEGTQWSRAYAKTEYYAKSASERAT